MSRNWGTTPQVEGMGVRGKGAGKILACLKNGRKKGRKGEGRE